MEHSLGKRDPGPLDGVRVLDFSQIIAGPYATRLLADLGAEVIKIEPLGGDLLRGAAPRRSGRSNYFAQLNCGKKSVALDLKQAAGTELALGLVERCDALVENFRPGVMDELGLGYEAVARRRTDIVYCSVSGYGHSGTETHRSAYAPVVQAFSGYDIAYMNYLEKPEKPIQGANATADYLSAAHLTGVLCAALFRRLRTGRGERVDLAMLDVMHNMLAYEIQEAQHPQPSKRTIYRPLRARDGFVVIAPVSPRNYEDLLRAVGRPEWREEYPLGGPQRGRNWARLMDALEEWTEPQSAADVERIVTAAGCPCARYRTPLESIHEEHVRVRGSVIEVDDGSGPFRVPNTPLVCREADVRLRPWVAELGQHTRETLRELLALPEERIAALVRQGVVGCDLPAPAR